MGIGYASIKNEDSSVVETRELQQTIDSLKRKLEAAEKLCLDVANQSKQRVDNSTYDRAQYNLAHAILKKIQEA